MPDIPSLLTVRMYDTGFGDCILLMVNQPRGPEWRMLIDCGSSDPGGGTRLDEVVADIIETVSQTSQPPHLNVIVASLTVSDHISGFEDDRWQDVSVAEVWLPWVENPDDRDALALKMRQEAAARAAAAALPIDAQPEVLALARNSTGTDRAEWTLLYGFTGSARRRFVSAAPNPRPVPGLAGGRVHFLAPPPAGDRLLEFASNPAQVLNVAAEQVSTGDAGAVFGTAYSVDPDDYARRWPNLASSRELVKQDDSGHRHLAALTRVDRSVRMHSLMFVLEVSGIRLFFPGDAHRDGWQRCLQDPGSRELLSSCEIYKLNQHGSRSGTPQEYIHDLLPSTATVLLSGPAAGRWPGIPDPDLLAELSDSGRIVISGETSAGPPADVRHHPDGLWIEFSLPRR